MFNDWDWDSNRSDKQEANFTEFKKDSRKLVVIELGAGEAVKSLILHFR